MREIKFKAWDKKRKEICIVLEMQLYGVYSKALLRSIKSGKEEWRKIGDMELMQFTGLKDATEWSQLSLEEQKNWRSQGRKKEKWDGKEIYEGNVVEFKDIEIDNGKFSGKTRIWFRHGCFVLDKVGFHAEGLGFYTPSLYEIDEKKLEVLEVKTKNESKT